jgi:hypothetical protein
MRKTWAAGDGAKERERAARSSRRICYPDLVRTFLTIILGLILCAATTVLTLVEGAVRVVGDADEIVALSHRAKARNALVDAVQQSLMREVGQAPPAAVRGAVDEVLAAEWVDGVVRRLHGALRPALVAAPASGMLQLQSFKGELERVVRELGERTLQQCTKLAGAAQCGPDQPARQAMEAQQRDALRAVQRINDEIDLAAAVTHDADEQAKVRRYLARAPSPALACAAALGSLFFLIVLVNIIPLRRLLGAAGLTLLLVAGVALGAHAAAPSMARKELELRERGAPGAAAVTDLTVELLEASARAARVPLLAAAVVGALLVVGAGAVRRR